VSLIAVRVDFLRLTPLFISTPFVRCQFGFTVDCLLLFHKRFFWCQSLRRIPQVPFFLGLPLSMMHSFYFVFDSLPPTESVVIGTQSYVYYFTQPLTSPLNCSRAEFFPLTGSYSPFFFNAFRVILTRLCRYSSYFSFSFFFLADRPSEGALHSGGGVKGCAGFSTLCSFTFLFLNLCSSIHHVLTPSP